jgi:hypothetical protein
MPRYYFDFQHLEAANCDNVGSELADDHAAQIEAVQAAAEWIKDNASFAGNELTVLVRDGNKPVSAVTASIHVRASPLSLEQNSSMNGVASPEYPTNPSKRSVK